LPEVSGGASAPPRLRDARGRFIAHIPARSDSELIAELLRKGVVRFRDPFHHVGVFTLRKHKSMKGFPVALYHSHHGRNGYGAWHVCTGNFDGYDEISPYGRQLAISPKAHYGWPGDKWEGDRSAWTVEGMASLLIHLARSVDLSRLDCGDFVGNHRGE